MCAAVREADAQWRNGRPVVNLAQQSQRLGLGLELGLGRGLG